MAALFHVEALRQRRQHGELARKLLTAFQNDFGAVVMFLYFSTDLNDLPRKLAYITDVLQIVGENDHSKAAESIIVAEVEIVSSLAPGFNSHYFPGNALGLPDVLVGLVEGNAASKGESGKCTHDNKRNQIAHNKILGRLRERECYGSEKNCSSFPK